MFEQRLPYGLWDADQHFPEPERCIPDYIDPKFRESGQVAVDVIRREPRPTGGGGEGRRSG